MIRNNKGFTLVELIVVVAIMAVLAGTVAGVVVSAQNKTKNSQANSSAEQLAKQFASNLNADIQKPVQDFININTNPMSWQPADTTKGIKSGEERFLQEFVNTFDEGAIIIDEDADIPKAGTNRYKITEDDFTFKIQFVQVGNGAKIVTFTIAIPDDNDHFFVTRSEE